MGNSYDLMVVDDEEIIREGISSYDWAPLGFNARAAFSNGAKAIDYLKANHVDVVITDIRMPILDGLELARWIREHRKSVRVVLLTVYKDFEYARTALSLGVATYLLKPIDLDELARTFSALRKELDAERVASTAPSAPSISPADTASTAAIMKAVDYINARYSSAINLEMLADLAEMNACYFSSQFKIVTGWNYQDYLVKLRIGEAQRLLREPGRRVSEVGRMVGYENTKYFTDVFKRETGLTPTEYRRAAMGGAAPSAIG